MFIRVTIIVVTLCVSCGCGRKSDDDLRKDALQTAIGGAARIERSGSNETVTLEESQARTVIATGDKLAVPETYPADGFIPDAAQLKTSVSQGEGVTIVYVVPGPLTDVIRRARDKLRDRGWVQDEGAEIHSGSGFAAYRKGTSILSEQFIKQDDGRIEVTQIYISGN